MNKATMALGAHQIRQIAVEACADARTVRRYLAAPSSVQSTSRVRLEAALARLGFELSTRTMERGDGE